MQTKAMVFKDHTSKHKTQGQQHKAKNQTWNFMNTNSRTSMVPQDLSKITAAANIEDYKI